MRCSGLSTGATLALGLPVLVLSAPLFPGPVLPLDQSPLAVVGGDFNGDGVPDLAVALSLQDQGEVRVGLGPVTAATPLRPHRVAFRPVAVATGDVDGDGFPDLATLSLREAKVSILLGRGDGTFEARPDLSVGARPGTFLAGFPQALVLGDLDGDGLDDVAIVDERRLVMALAAGGGRFEDPHTVSLSLSSLPVAVRIGDLNGDGRKDVVVADPNLSELVILPGVAGGLPGVAAHLPVGIVPQALALADLDGDGHLDLAVADLRSEDLSTFAGEIRVLQGDGSGSFGQPVSYRVGIESRDLAIADMDADGILDLLVVSVGSDEIWILKGTGSGAFAPHQTLYAGNTPVSLVVADLDQDGAMDAAVAAAGTAGVSLLHGKGRGELPSSPRVAMPDRIPPGQIQAADFNGDGHVDLAVPTDRVLGSGTSGRLVFFAGTGGGAFDAPEDHAVGLEPGRGVVDDLDGDGLPDLVLPLSGASGVSILPGVPGGSLAPERRLSMGQDPFDLDSGDLNSDGKPDLAVLAASPPRMVVFLADGNGFQGPAVRMLDHSPNSILMAEVTGDGNVDVVVSRHLGDGAGELHILPGDGRGELGEALVIPRPDEPWLVRAARLDRDPLLDLIAITAVFRDVDVLRNVHPGRRLQHVKLSQHLPAFLTDLELADLDRDGLVDVIVAAPGLGTLSVFRGRPGRRFGPEERYLAGSGPVTLAVADLDGDGWMDLAVSNSGDRDLVLCLNQGGRPQAPGGRLTPSGAAGPEAGSPPPGRQ